MNNCCNEHKEGFWKSSCEPDLPSPAPNDTPWEGQNVFVQQLKHVEQNAKCVRYRGFSTCRVCGCLNGTKEFSHNNWKWPEGLMHYIVEHNVQPSIEFQEMINKAR